MTPIDGGVAAGGVEESGDVPLLDAGDMSQTSEAGQAAQDELGQVAQDGGQPPADDVPQSLIPGPSPGVDESLGLVRFEFTVEDPERYCRANGSQSFAVVIEDEQGYGFSSGGTDNHCYQANCEACAIREDCDPLTVTSGPSTSGAGGTTVWDGRRVQWSSCSDDGMQISCLLGSYAPAGHYTAMFCASHAVPISDPGDPEAGGCEFVGPGRDCIRVEFDYPEDTLVTAEMPAGGLDPDDWTVPCGNVACPVTRGYCDVYNQDGLSVGYCEPMPEPCRSDLTCECLQPYLPADRFCQEGAVDRALRVSSARPLDPAQPTAQ
jgi:hypothetical protein